MSAYKKLNKQDVYVSTYTAQKSWAASGSSAVLKADYGIELINCVSGSSPYFNGNDDTVNNRSTALTWKSINHLYYSLVDADGHFTGSYDNYLQTSFVSSSRNLAEVGQ